MVVNYLDFHDYFDAFAVIATEVGEGLKTEFLETVKCEVFDSKLSHILSKSTCMPQSDKIKLFGSFNSGYGSILDLKVVPKPGKEQELIELLKKVNEIKLTFFTLELQLDFSEFDHPLTKRLNEVVNLQICYDSAEGKILGFG